MMFPKKGLSKQIVQKYSVIFKNRLEIYFLYINIPRQKCATVMLVAWNLQLVYSVILIAAHFLKKNIFAFQLAINTLEINSHVYKTILNLVSCKRFESFPSFMHKLEHNLEIFKKLTLCKPNDSVILWPTLVLWISRLWQESL